MRSLTRHEKNNNKNESFRVNFLINTYLDLMIDLNIYCIFVYILNDGSDHSFKIKFF